MNSKGFLLLDGLLVVAITINICLMCFSIYRVISKDEESENSFKRQENDFYYELFISLEDCEVCRIDESD